MSLSFVVIIVDTPEQADAINSLGLSNLRRRISAFYVGQIMHGIRFRSIRPTKVIHAHRKLTSEKELRWLHTIVRPVGGPDTEWIGGDSIE